MNKFLKAFGVSLLIWTAIYGVVIMLMVIVPTSENGKKYIERHKELVYYACRSQNFDFPNPEGNTTTPAQIEKCKQESSLVPDRTYFVPASQYGYDSMQISIDGALGDRVSQALVNLFLFWPLILLVIFREKSSYFGGLFAGLIFIILDYAVFMQRTTDGSDGSFSGVGNFFVLVLYILIFIIAPLVISLINHFKKKQEKN